MKIGDFAFVKSGSEREALIDQLNRFNDTAVAYPRDRTVHALFAEQARKTPDAVALMQEDQVYTYRQLDETSNRIARFLIQRSTPPEAFIAFQLDQVFHILSTVIGVLKAGCAYFPLDTDTPYERMKYMLNNTRSPVLFFESSYLREANRLQWDCPALHSIVCMDSDDVSREWEQLGELMKEDVWDYVGQTTFDDISGGGWKSSYTGEWLSREVMDDYGDNILKKLKPLLTPEMRILEIGCASGISMFRLAPLVKEYCGTDLSHNILQWTKQECSRRGADNIQLHHLPAHELHRLDDSGFDVVIINSVLQCFSGHNYLRRVLRTAIEKMNPHGWIFLGNVWDQDLKEDFTQSLLEYRRHRAKPGERTIVDHSEALFINRRFLEDLRHDLPAIQSIETGAMLTEHPSELDQYGFDALLRVDKTQTPLQGQSPRHKYQFDRREIDRRSREAFSEKSHPKSLAYIMYTSGTTGQPKGVLIEHRSIVRLVKNNPFLTVTPDDCILQTGALAFDASTFEFWAALLNGARLCRPRKHEIIDARSLKHQIQRYGATVIFLTTSLFNQIVESDLTVFEGLRVVLTGGEKNSPDHINQVRRAFDDLLLIHAYGPTENTTFTTTYRIDECHDRDIPIGRPIANTQVCILDYHREPVPVGVSGEIYAGGDGLARGYLNDDALTAEKFIPHPWRENERLYRTGDLGRWRADGVIEYLGRIDDQVKIRGHRIEPMEIETVLCRLQRIREAVVLARTAREGQTQLIAYFTADQDFDATHAQEALKHTLPDYMIPSYFVRMERMPLSPNGKVDRKALPSPQDEHLIRSRHYESPQGEIEEQLCAIWREVIGGHAPGVTDDFFESGGHSLTVSKLVSRIQQRMGVVIPLATIFERPTIRQLAAVILDNAQYGIELADQPRVRLNRLTGSPFLFALPPGTGDAASFIQLAERLRSVAFYGFNFIESPRRLQEYARLIVEIDPTGPYRLLGYSSGGNLAYHVAGELERQGYTVTDIILIDSGRKLEPMRFDPNEVQAVIDEFLSHESNRPYLKSRVLIEKARRMILNSYAYFERSVDHHTVSANLHLLLCDASQDVFCDEFGRILSNKTGWKEVTRGAFQTYHATGGHNQMLSMPSVEHNAQLIQKIIEKCSSSKG